MNQAQHQGGSKFYLRMCLFRHKLAALQYVEHGSHFLPGNSNGISLIMLLPFQQLYFRIFISRKSTPFSIWVIDVLSCDRNNPHSLRKYSTIGFTLFSSTSFVLPVMIKSSA
jgi:hypothetical protein